MDRGGVGGLEGVRSAVGKGPPGSVFNEMSETRRR